MFQNLPTAFGTNIVININRAHTVNDVAILSILRMSNGDAFVPNEYTYTAVTGTVALPQGLQVQQVGVQASGTTGTCSSKSGSSDSRKRNSSKRNIRYVRTETSTTITRYGSDSGKGTATSRQRKLKVKASTECTSMNTSRESATISRCTAMIKCCTCRSRYRGTKSSTASFI
ncbi:hypothetical protein FLA4_04600 [Candidatus Rickettsia kotlanii]|nr:hypothetical protein FLA4_04600 [Candidatus Rickettsia kotlanii]BDU61293.1 hypothetical protein HM2_04610 [Candidatus Rickettsia kotlanii]